MDNVGDKRSQKTFAQIMKRLSDTQIENLFRSNNNLLNVSLLDKHFFVVAFLPKFNRNYS